MTEPQDAAEERELIVGTYASRHDAERAMAHLKDRGFPMDAVHLDEDAGVHHIVCRWDEADEARRLLEEDEAERMESHF